MLVGDVWVEEMTDKPPKEAGQWPESPWEKFRRKLASKSPGNRQSFSLLTRVWFMF